MPPLGVAHHEALTAVYADQDVARHIGGAALDATATLLQLERFEDVWREHGWGQSALVHRASGAFLGRAGLHPWPGWEEVELGFVVARPAQRRGYGYEAASAWLRVAFEELRLMRLTAVVEPGNVASLALLERLGFAPDRRDTTPAGVEVVVLALSR